MPKKKIKKKYEDFARFNKDMKRAEGYIGQIFEEVAQKAGIIFVNKAKTITREEGLVDTGNYRRNWTTDIAVIDNKYRVIGYNPIEYASHLEYGYKLKKDQFIPFDKMEGTPQTKAFIARFKAKYPNAKGFIRKAGRYKGKFVGTQAIKEAQEYAVNKLKDQLGDLFKD